MKVTCGCFETWAIHRKLVGSMSLLFHAHTQQYQDHAELTASHVGEGRALETALVCVVSAWRIHVSVSRVGFTFVCFLRTRWKATTAHDHKGMLTAGEMPVTYCAPNSTSPTQLRRPYFPGHRSSYLELIPEEELEAFARMEEVDDGNAKKIKSASSPEIGKLEEAKEQGRDSLKPPPADAKANDTTPMEDGSYYSSDYLNAGGGTVSGMDTPSTPGLSRSSSSADVSSSGFESFGQDSFPPVDRLTMFDILENFALPQRLERMQNAIHDNAEKLRRQRARIASGALRGKNNIVGEWRKRVPTGPPDEQLDKYRRRMRDSVDRLNKRWSDAKTVTMNEKISFVTAVLNIFISGYLIGGWPEYFHYWYTAQLAYGSSMHPICLSTRLTSSIDISCRFDGTSTTRSASITSSRTCATTSTSCWFSVYGSFRNPNACSSRPTVSPSATTR